MPIGLGLTLPNSAAGGIYNRVLGVVEQLLLDAYPGAAAAYSTRLLDTAYSGAALRVRRSNDNAEQDIGFSGGNLDEAALTAFVGTNSAFVTTWYDQSGNARHATQTTAANQPRIVNAGVVDKRNGRVGPWFNNASNFMSFTPTVPTGAVYSVFAASWYKNDDGSNFSTVIAGVAGAAAFHTGNGNLNANGAGGVAGGVTIARSQQAAIIASGAIANRPKFAQTSWFTVNNANSIYSNGSLAASNTANGAFTQPISLIGYNGLGEFNSDVMGEVILYPSDQSANRAAIESSIMSYFGIPRAGDTLSVNNNSDELATNGSGDTLGVA